MANCASSVWKVVISATDERLTESDKNRMIREAKDRVSQMLRTKISESRHEEARNMLERAEATLAALGDHPMSTDLNGLVTQLRGSIEAGDESTLDDTIDEMLRLLAEIEASA